MRPLFHVVVALLISVLCVVIFRAVAFSVHVVEGTALAPQLLEGDRIVVNRWSYGLRTGTDNGLFRYGRLLARPVRRGDIVVIDNPTDTLPGVYVCRCRAVAGDTITIAGDTYMLPGRDATCAGEDYYWFEALGDGSSADSRTFGPVAESHIIGRVCLVLYSIDKAKPFHDRLRTARTFLPIYK